MCLGLTSTSWLYHQPVPFRWSNYPLIYQCGKHLWHIVSASGCWPYFVSSATFWSGSLSASLLVDICWSRQRGGIRVGFDKRLFVSLFCRSLTRSLIRPFSRSISHHAPRTLTCITIIPVTGSFNLRNYISPRCHIVQRIPDDDDLGLLMECNSSSNQ